MEVTGYNPGMIIITCPMIIPIVLCLNIMKTLVKGNTEVVGPTTYGWKQCKNKIHFMFVFHDFTSTILLTVDVKI